MRARVRVSTALIAGLLLAAAAPAQTFRDPMRPAGATPAAPPARRTQAVAALKLEGIIAGPALVAIVNGRLVRAGDEVGGATIVEVLHDSVRYSRAGRIQTLALRAQRPFPGVRVARSAEAITP
jgi:CubicO group peptidase (beta-lactamase class C family)